MEAVLASDESDKDAAARARMNSVYDSLNRLESKYFFIGRNIQGAPETPPPARRIRSFLANQLESLNPEEITEVYESEVNAVPKWFFEHEGWKVEFFPIPKSREAREEPGVRPLAFWQYGPYWSTTRAAIRGAIVAKSGRYGLLDRPFIIAVDALGGGVDHEDEFFVLFGDEQWNVAETSSGETIVEPKTRPNGAWPSGSGPRYTRVSGALIVRGAHCWRIPDAGLCLYYNPWATKPYTGPLDRLPRAIPENDRMKWLQGQSLADIFELPLGWPEIT